ncbi:MAG: methylated-DNA--[protein]-cysteine S-methyltransferase [Phycisphaerales bacterium]|jgi:methylated-DNA-[protein]-cysteine S-methyltransferase|nr:methylated-DNA--[protein]-cysteine S-methyltransferase [Phycisphaerales bacterium]
MILHTEIGPLSIGYIHGSFVCDFGTVVVERDPSKKVVQQLEKYFDGEIIHEFDAPLPQGTPFTHRCWEACRQIPYGSTCTYKELATAAGSPQAARAAGQAMRNNPTSILTPCHRVVASTGKLHGFAGQTNPQSKELRRKAYLLHLEQTAILRVS